MLEILHATRRFGDVVAVDDVSFTVPGGALTGFVGANGAGKTTTMRMIMGVLQMTAGEIRWQGQPITTADRSRFGYMPEERGLYPKQAICDQLVYLGQLQGLSAAQARASAAELLERFGLSGRVKDKLEKLSLGNQQRVQIVAAMIAKPQALILDEPFSGLDPTAMDDMVGMLREFVSGGAPVLFSSHQLDVVERICDGLVILSDGHVAAHGTPHQLRERGAVLHRLVLDGDAGWVGGMPGLQVIDLDGHEALIEITAPGAGQELLATALGRGQVREFARVRPSLNQIYREVTGQ